MAVAVTLAGPVCQNVEQPTPFVRHSGTDLEAAAVRRGTDRACLAAFLGEIKSKLPCIGCCFVAEWLYGEANVSTTHQSLILREDGIAIDQSTGLVWMIPLVGQGWSGGQPTGQGAKFSWTEASSRFGRARNINANALDCNWARTGTRAPYFQKYPLNHETYRQYAPGRKRLEFAGRTDWRLPTIEEYWSLSETEFAGTLLDPRQSCFLFQPPHLWTANPSTSSVSGFVHALIDMGFCAWLFQLDSTYPDGFGDMRTEVERHIRLVRGGAVFGAVSD